MRLWQQIFDKVFDKDLVYLEFDKDLVFEPNSKYDKLLLDFAFVKRRLRVFGTEGMGSLFMRL